MKHKTALLLGGDSPEREISLLSGRAVADALRALGEDFFEFDPARDDWRALSARGATRAFVILHGGMGENGGAQGALTALRIPYTGAGHAACALAMNKKISKIVWRAAGLATADFVAAASAAEAESALAALGLPLFVKPNEGGSSLAATAVTSAAELPPAIEAALAHGPLAMIEKLIAGVDYTVGILAGEALPSIRIEAAADFYDYRAKYFSDETRYVCPSGLTAARERELGDLALRAFAEIGGRGWGRVDFIVAADGAPFLLEANTAPGMTSHSLVPMAARARGLDFNALVARILEEAAL